MADGAFTTTLRGGAQVGWVWASWPLARLAVSRHELRLSCLAEHVFTPADVVAVEPLRGLAGGVRILHNRRDCPRDVVFTRPGGAAAIGRALAGAGFVPAGVPRDLPSGMPLRWGAVVFAVAVWNALLLWGMAGPGQAPGQFGPYVLAAVLFLLAASTAVRVSPALQRRVLREGREVGEIRGPLRLVQIVSGLMAAVLVGMRLAGIAGG